MTTLPLAQVGYSNWADEAAVFPEGEMCVRVNGRGEWLDVSCSENLDVICERSKCKFTILYKCIRL